MILDLLTKYFVKPQTDLRKFCPFCSPLYGIFGIWDSLSFAHFVFGSVINITKL